MAVSSSDPPKTDWFGLFLEYGAFLLFALLLVPAGVVGYAIGHRDAHATTTVTVAQTGTKPAPKAAAAILPAPAFGSDQLAAQPTSDWITNGGSLANDRYSPLDEID